MQNENFMVYINYDLIYDLKLSLTTKVNMAQRTIKSEIACFFKMIDPNFVSFTDNIYVKPVICIFFLQVPFSIPEEFI